MLVPSLMLILGLAAGALIVWLILRERIIGKDSELNEMRSGRNEALEETQALRSQLQVEVARRSTAEAEAARVSELESEAGVLEQRLASLQTEIRTLTASLAESEAKRGEEAKASRQTQALLTEVRQEFGAQFKTLANEILEDKSKRFTELNKSNLDGLLVPLGKEIQEFKQKVEKIEGDRTKDQGFLQSELKNLRELNQQISQDAINLTNALRGQSKTLGDLGQVILEDILEYSGLEREREFLVQESLRGLDGRRQIPDVIINLPHGRHLVIDAKASLAAYERYCSLSDGPERDKELKKHTASVREHVKNLSEKRYQDQYSLNSVDFVLMFVPFDPAFTLAMQYDPNLFRDAFEKGVIVVGPWTLLATMRTIENLWRPEKLGRNVAEIARQAGNLYDKFVDFVRDLEQIGEKLKGAQISFENAHKRLTSGKGNLVRRIEVIRELGAKVKKKFPESFRASALEDSEPEDPIYGEELGATQPRLALPEPDSDPTPL